MAPSTIINTYTMADCDVGGGRLLLMYFRASPLTGVTGNLSFQTGRPFSTGKRNPLNENCIDSDQQKKGTRKTPVEEAFISKDHGLEGDAHAGKWHRQVSFLSSESIESVKDQGLDVTFGDFAENIASVGIDWKTLPLGTRVKLGDAVIVEITQIGKECHNKCAIYYMAGDCIMPREGVFAKVLEEGTIHRGDEIQIL